MRIKNVLRMVIVAVLTAVLLLACDSDDDAGGGGFPVPLPINCVVPGECLSVTASWCVPSNDGVVNCATNNVDVSLDLPGGGTVGVGAGELLDLAGCIHDGDDQAGPPLDRDGDGQFGPLSEKRRRLRGPDQRELSLICRLPEPYPLIERLHGGGVGTAGSRNESEYPHSPLLANLLKTQENYAGPDAGAEVGTLFVCRTSRSRNHKRPMSEEVDHEQVGRQGPQRGRGRR